MAAARFGAGHATFYDLVGETEASEGGAGSAGVGCDGCSYQELCATLATSAARAPICVVNWKVFFGDLG